MYIFFLAIFAILFQQLPTVITKFVKLTCISLQSMCVSKQAKILDWGGQFLSGIPFILMDMYTVTKYILYVSITELLTVCMGNSERENKKGLHMSRNRWQPVLIKPLTSCLDISSRHLNKVAFI